MNDRAKGVLEDPPGLQELGDETSGQLGTEWLLVTGAIVMPIVMLVPYLNSVIRTYFYRIAEVVGLPFP